MYPSDATALKWVNNKSQRTFTMISAIVIKEKNGQDNTTHFDASMTLFKLSTIASVFVDFSCDTFLRTFFY